MTIAIGALLGMLAALLVGLIQLHDLLDREREHARHQRAMREVAEHQLASALAGMLGASFHRNQLRVSEFERLLWKPTCDGDDPN